MSEWETVSIAKLGRVVTGKTPPTASAEYFGGDELFVSPRDLSRNSYYVAKTETRITSKALEKFKNQVIPRNSILFTSLSFAFGKMGIAQRSLLTNQQINSVIVNSSNNYKFVFYLLKVYEDIIFSYNSGIDTPIVPKSVFEKIKVRIPQKKIQIKIAAVLSAYDDLIENNRRRIALLERMAEQLYREWFVRFRFPGYQHAKFEKGLPAGWKQSRVAELVVRQSFGRVYKEHELSAQWEGGVIVIDQSRNDFLGFHNGEPQHHGSTNRPILLFGDHTCKMVLMTTSFSLAENVIPFRPKDQILPHFLFHMIRDLTETTEYKRHWTDLCTKHVLSPPQNLQEEFENQAIALHEQQLYLQRSCSAAERARDLLLPRLISGKLRVDQLDIQFPPSMQAESA